MMSESAEDRGYFQYLMNSGEYIVFCFPDPRHYPPPYEWKEVEKGHVRQDRYLYKLFSKKYDGDKLREWISGRLSDE